jgi:hypothetical protein
MNELADYRDQYTGRLFIVGTGPSLLDLTPRQIKALNQEHLFTGSRYFDWHDAPLDIAFYVMTERRQATAWLENGWYRKASAHIAKFWVDWQPPPDDWVRVKHPYGNAHDVLNHGLFGHLEGKCSSAGPVGESHIAHGKITPMAAIQLARYMGFTQFYSIGCEGTGVGDVYDTKRVRGMHSPGIEKTYMGVARHVLIDCTPGGLNNDANGGLVPYKPLDDVLGLG